MKVLRMALVSMLLLGGCSFIDDWGRFTTRPNTTEDGGSVDGGPVDAGRDARTCVDECDPSGAECAAGEVCATGPGGCLVCVACDGCDPATCGTVCELVPGTTQCTCAARSGEGGACTDTSQCEVGLECSAGLCLYQCGVDSDCVGSYTQCVDGVCYVRAGEVDCANGVDDDSDGFIDCDDFDCASDPSMCPGSTGGEWELCESGACGAGLVCRNDVCYRDCSVAADCSGDYPECRDEDSDGVMECSPTLGCDFVYDTGCGAGLECRLLSFDPATGVGSAGCLRQSSPTLPVGSACSGSPRCEVRSECLTDGTGAGICYAWCYMDDPAGCPAGTACMPLGDPPPVYMGRAFGVCA